MIMNLLSISPSFSQSECLVFLYYLDDLPLLKGIRHMAVPIHLATSYFDDSAMASRSEPQCVLKSL